MLREAATAMSALLLAAAPLQQPLPPRQLRQQSRRLHAADEVYTSQIVDELAEMQENWDGYGALAINRETARNAKKALSNLLVYLSAPEIIPNPNGTLTFEWISDHGEAHLEIGMNRFSSFMKRAGAGSIPVEGSADCIPFGLGPLIASAVYPRLGTVAPLTNLRLTADHERETW